MFMRGVFNQYMRAHSFYKTGLVTEDSWANVASTASWLMTTPGGRLFFPSNQLPDEFADEIKLYDGVPQDFTLGRELPTECP